MIEEPLERRRQSSTAPITKSVTILGVLIVLAVISLTVMAVMLVRLNSLVEDNKAASDYIIECTTPGPKPPPHTGHRCFDEGQARTAQAIKQIIDALKGAP